MIEVARLQKKFGAIAALNDVSFRVDAGEIIGLLGPNGAGKTTMMRVLTGYLPPTAGRARVAGHDVQDDPIAVRRHIGYLPETVPVYTELTVERYLRFVAELRELPRGEIRSRLADAMERTGTLHVAHRLIGHLSKGYRQRVGLAQALLHQPDLLILDEPTVGLDPKQVVEIRSVIRELAARHTVVLSSHILPEVSQICSRVIVIDGGRIVAIDTQARLEERLKGGGASLHLELRAPTDAALEALRGVAGVRAAAPAEGGRGFTLEADAGRDVREDVFRLAAGRGWPILELRPLSMSLEEVFLRLTTHEGGGAPDGQGGAA